MPISAARIGIPPMPVTTMMKLATHSQRQMSRIDIDSLIQRTLYIAILGPLHTIGNDNIYIGNDNIYYFDISLRGVVSHRITCFRSRKSFTLAAIVAIYTSEYVSYALILHSLLQHFTHRVASFNMLYASIF